MMFKTLMTIGVLQVVTMLFLLIRTKVLAVLLGPEMVGPMAVIDKLLLVIAQTVSLSLPFAAIRFLPAEWAKGPADYRALFERMRNVLVAAVLVVTAVAVAVTLIRPATWGPELLPYRNVVAVAMLGLPALAVFPFLVNAVAGRLKQNRASAIVLANAAMFAIAAAGAWWRGLIGFYAVYAVVGTAMASAIGYLALRDLKTSAPIRRRWPPDLTLPAQVWRFSLAMLVLTFLAPFAALFVHKRVLGMHGAESAGWMQAAFGIGLAVRSVLGAAHGIFLTPNVNRGGEARDRMEWANRFHLMFALFAGILVPPLLLFPRLAIDILYSPEFGPGAEFVVIFVLTDVLLLVSGTYQAIVVALDRLTFHVLSNVVAQLLVVAVAAVAIGPLGILGAGLSVAIAPVFLFVVTMTFLARAHGLRMPGAVVFRTLWMVAGLAGAGVVGARVAELTPAALVTRLTVYGAIVAGFALSLGQDERSRARAMLGRLVNRRA